jgi:hypothetical protein
VTDSAETSSSPPTAGAYVAAADSAWTPEPAAPMSGDEHPEFLVGAAFAAGLAAALILKRLAR